MRYQKKEKNVTNHTNSTPSNATHSLRSSTKTNLAISVLEAGMPMAITPFILGELYPMERELIALSIVISCVVSMVTLPIIMVLVGVV